MLRSSSAAALAALLGLLAGSVHAAESPRNYALTHATAITEPGVRIEDATVVLRDGLIVSIQAGGTVPSDAVEIDATDLFVYAGLIDAESDLQGDADSAGGGRGPGAGGFGSAPETKPGAVHPLPLVHPEGRAADALRAFEDDRKRSMEKIRDLGFTVVLAAPGDGIFRGTSAAILLAADEPVAKILLAGDVAQHASFQRGRFGAGYPTSLMGSIATLRQTLLDARRYAEWNARYQADPSGMSRPERHAAFEALLPVLDGKKRVIFHTSHPLDTLMADRLGREFGLAVVVSTSSYEAEYTAALADAGRPMIVSTGFPEEPELDDEDEQLAVSRQTMRRYLDAPAGPSKLHEAGIEFALTTSGLDAKSTFHKQMHKIVEAGLPEDVALAALTTVPAKLLGIDRVVGTLTPGKIANLVVTDGPLFAEKTKIREVFVDGTRHELEIKDKPKGDPDAVVDPRGTWAVAIKMGSRTMEREWTIEGSEGAYKGTAETGGGIVSFDSVELAGNVMTVIFPSRQGRPSMEVTVIIEGESFEGTAEMGPRTMELTGNRTSGPEGGAR